MRISFVIPAHNEEALLERTLEAISRSARSLSIEHQAIVADDGSTDATVEIARRRGAVVVSHDRRQIAATRNLGARAASGDLLIFVDADTVVNAGAVGEAVAAVRAGAAGGGAPVRFDGRVPAYARAMLWGLNLAFRLLRLTGGCFLFCTPEAFGAVGGWDESLYASEEISMAAAIKRRGRFVIVRTPVVTSGRKLRTFTPWELLGALAPGLVKGRRHLERREGLGLWYGPRRPDPGHPADDRHLSNP